ncbi:lipoyl(octanoyl) transferase LipB [Corynebacterium caspium]|uniref:lipoyl(octanoyl) transferase LipB n=1 Tax=Corynebacterium caspium TaxID=234828 RepID=UPI000380BCFE|nr:lipoyl(octanoyl) transferase LipB [Corynebacterium caspium]WKD58957.1 Octanoyltransferase [Corynebacterium caspium DSM 44850]
MTNAPRDPFFPAELSIRAQQTPPEIRYLGVVEYQEAWDLQAELAAQRYRGEIGDTILVLQHPDIYTAGKRTQPEDRPVNGLPVIDVDRGGRITWHGLGQLVVYPIIKLAEPLDVVDYVRRLEEGLIAAIRMLGLPQAGRILGRSGVWLAADASGRPDRKIAALGIRVTHGVTMHGLALNCSNTLEFYDYIIPCGITDAGVTTLSLELGHDVEPDACTPAVLTNLIAALDGELSVSDHTIGSAPDPTKNLPPRH